MQNNPSEHEKPYLSFFERGGGWVVIQFVIMVGWVALTPLGHTLARSPGLLIPALSLLGIGGWLGIAGTRVLGKNRTPFPKPNNGSQLVQTGVYALVRHPLYASLIAMSCGWACLWGSELGVVLALVQAIFLDAKTRREEHWLRRQFPEYANYTARVRRLIPLLY